MPHNKQGLPIKDRRKDPTVASIAYLFDSTLRTQRVIKTVKFLIALIAGLAVAVGVLLYLYHQQTDHNTCAIQQFLHLTISRAKELHNPGFNDQVEGLQKVVESLKPTYQQCIAD